MRSRSPGAALSTLVLAVGCSGKSSPPPPSPTPAPPGDAGIDGITQIGTNDPTRFTDPDPSHSITRPVRPKDRAARPIDIILRTTPPGAVAAVDGVQIGLTPAYWFGESDGREHEFTFTRRGYASGRYRFVPITSGTIHATLDPVAEDPQDGGLAAPSSPTFSAEPRVNPPETVITIDAGMAVPIDAAEEMGRGPQP